MHAENKPLFTLSIAEFMALINNTVEGALKEKFKVSEDKPKEEEQHFNIGELSKFLGCTKVSIHNYKKRGLPYYKIGRTILFKKSEVLVFMRKLRKLAI